MYEFTLVQTARRVKTFTGFYRARVRHRSPPPNGSEFVGERLISRQHTRRDDVKCFFPTDLKLILFSMTFG